MLKMKNLQRTESTDRIRRGFWNTNGANSVGSAGAGQFLYSKWGFFDRKWGFFDRKWRFFDWKMRFYLFLFLPGCGPAISDSYGAGLKIRRFSVENWWISIEKWWIFVETWWISVETWWISVDKWWISVDKWWIYVEQWWIPVEQWWTFVEKWWISIEKRWISVENDGFMLKNDGFLLKMMDLYWKWWISVENDGFLLKNDGFLLRNDGFLLKMMDFCRSSRESSSWGLFYSLIFLQYKCEASSTEKYDLLCRSLAMMQVGRFLIESHQLFHVISVIVR